MTKRLRKITKIDLPISMILKIIFTDECINVSKWHSLYVNIFFPSIANLKCTPSDRKGSPKGTCIPVTWQISTVFFWWLSLPATHFTSIYRITVLHILHFIPRAKELYQLYYTLFPLHWKQLRLWWVCSLDDPWSFAASNSPMHSIHRCTWKSLQFFIIIIMMASFMRVL